MDYNEFLMTKFDYGANNGFEPLLIPDYLFDFQKDLVNWSINKGRSAIFADCGMGKTIMELVVGHNFVMKTNKPVLLLTPLTVSGQTLDEAEKFGLDAQRAIPGKPLRKTVCVTNYEKLHHFNPDDFGGMICDESSILKNFNGKRKSEITEFMRQIPYRLLGTATAAPNDWFELGTSSEALGYLGHQDMINKYFTNRQNSAALTKSRFYRADKWRLKPHAARGRFWEWVAFWARALRKPSDLGYSNDGFILPPLIENKILIESHKPRPGMLFDVPAVSFHESREVIRRTIKERCETVAENVKSHDIAMVWCNLNDESSLLKKLIPNSVEITGSHSPEKKEEAAKWFCNGSDSKRVLISKPKIFGFGLNFQHCNYMTYFPDYSYEKYYQATRRLWRFGQINPVTVDHIYTHGGERMMQAIEDKAKLADTMFEKLVKYMNSAINVENIYTENQGVMLPQWIM